MRRFFFSEKFEWQFYSCAHVPMLFTYILLYILKMPWTYWNKRENIWGSFRNFRYFMEFSDVFRHLSSWGQQLWSFTTWLRLFRTCKLISSRTWRLAFLRTNKKALFAKQKRNISCVLWVVTMFVLCFFADYSWWLNQLIWKICASQIGSLFSTRFGVKIPKMCELPPPSFLFLLG